MTVAQKVHQETKTRKMCSTLMLKGSMLRPGESDLKLTVPQRMQIVEYFAYALAFDGVGHWAFLTPSDVARWAERHLREIEEERSS